MTHLTNPTHTINPTSPTIITSPPTPCIDATRATRWYAPVSGWHVKRALGEEADESQWIEARIQH